ncbi:helix-turn-helix domain-containing protein [Metabacillus litoralis]|uniref:helix-turn-helix domain-containing protein n=1 Tax=Metabacillus litoralis TaxID=152268 RepID=UPI00203E239D|nr:helix-turn-helix transcriptional regulator [Metabacillus litoralis]MCM3411496.1 helix-turn-helix domain-containing protein [Metabacillus litoralis]
MPSLGERLRKAREQKRLSQLEVYRRTNISNKTLSRYENGGSQPDVETLKTLATLYEVSVNSLLGVEEPWYKKDDKDEDAQFILRAKQDLSKEAFDELMDFTKRMKKMLEDKDAEHGN